MATRTVPADISTLGRGAAQRHILTELDRVGRGNRAGAAPGEIPLTYLKCGYRGHFAGLMSAANALEKRGLLRIRLDDHHGYVYRLCAHTHEG